MVRLVASRRGKSCYGRHGVARSSATRWVKLRLGRQVRARLVSASYGAACSVEVWFAMAGAIGHGMLYLERNVIVDLTMDVCDGMLTYPAHWHPRAEVTQLGRHGVEGRETRRLVMGTHTGTHIDAPRHFIRDGITVDQIPLDQLNGPAILLDFTQRPVQEITREMVVNAVSGRVCGRVLLRYDWDKFNDSSAYYRDHPYLTIEASQWLVERGCVLIGMDTPSPDRSNDEQMPVHKRLLGQEVVLVEYLTGLSSLPREMSFHLTVAPLKLKGCDGAPARVFATF